MPTLSKQRARRWRREGSVDSAKRKLAEVNAKPDMPLPSGLNRRWRLARADLTSAEIALERTRVRAPADGTVLNMIGKAGETAVPSPESALVVFGDLSSLRLRAEVEERDAAKIHVGQRVVVKADAFPDKKFEGIGDVDLAVAWRAAHRDARPAPPERR